MDWLERLTHPAREYTPIPFWFLNGDLTHREIRRQLRDFCDHGVHGVVLHPRIGLSRRIGYLSPLFFRYLRTAIETARELGMRVVLYDEGMYPSGSACGLVVKEHLEWASRGVTLTETLGPEDTLLCETEQGKLVERPSGGTIRGIHFGEDDGEPCAPPSADILNPAAVERFVELTHEAYYREFGEYFGSTIIGFFTDEPSILGRNVAGMMPWTLGFAELFQQAGGRLEGLVGLFTGEENEDTALYRQLILQREGEVYYARLSRWCEEHGIALMGHPHQSDDIEVEKYFHVPGQDLVFRWVAPEKGANAGMDSVMGHCSADMAQWMGRKRNSNECFGACNREGNPWHFTGSDMKWYIDWLAARGVNLFIPHAFYYSLRGKRSGERPPDVGPGNIWWLHYGKWATYMARLSCLRAEAKTNPKVAVLCRNRDLHPEVAAKLLKNQIEFMYLPESLWPECAEKEGKLFCRDKVFEVVMGPENLFPGVPHDFPGIPRECSCDPPQPELRVIPLDWQGQRMWLCVNEGSHPLETELTLEGKLPLGQYDLWTGRVTRVNSQAEGPARKFRLGLERNESRLLFACESEEAWRAWPEELMPQRRLTAADFSLQSEDPTGHRKIYTAQFIPQGEERVTVEVSALEMVELYANDSLVDAAFWPPQRFEIPQEMLGGEQVELRLVLTGSKANQYGNSPVPYGLGDE